MHPHGRRGLRQAGEAAGPLGTTVACSCESHNYRGYDWRDGGLAGRRYEYFDVSDVADRGKPARPPALQVRRSRVRANRIIIAGQGSQRGRQLHIKSEVDDISIVHDVLFAFRSHLPIFFGFNFASCGNEIVVGNDFRSDVSALEV